MQQRESASHTPIERTWETFPASTAIIGAYAANSLKNTGIAEITFVYKKLENWPPDVSEQFLSYPTTVSAKMHAASEEDVDTWNRVISYVSKRLFNEDLGAEDFTKDRAAIAQTERRRIELVDEAIQRIGVLKDRGEVAPFDPASPISEKEKIDARIALLTRRVVQLGGTVAVPVFEARRPYVNDWDMSELSCLRREIDTLRVTLMGLDETRPDYISNL